MNNLKFTIKDEKISNAHVCITQNDNVIVEVHIYKKIYGKYTIEFISTNNQTNITLIYFIMNVINDLGFCPWYEFDACSIINKGCRVLNYEDYSVTVYDKKLIENKSINTLAKIEINNGFIKYHEVNLISVYHSLVSVYDKKYECVPNLYAYLYRNGETYINSENNDHDINNPNEWYNYDAYTITGIKDRNDINYIKKYYDAEIAMQNFAQEILDIN